MAVMKKGTVKRVDYKDDDHHDMNHREGMHETNNSSQPSKKGPRRGQEHQILHEV